MAYATLKEAVPPPPPQGLPDAIALLNIPAFNTLTVICVLCVFFFGLTSFQESHQVLAQC